MAQTDPLEAGTQRVLGDRQAVIAGRPVGFGLGAWIVGELGVTHEGDIGLAKRMIDESLSAGVDAVKVECIDADALVAAQSRNEMEYTYRTASGQTRSENYWQLLKRLSLSPDEIAVLAGHARSAGIAFFGTAFDIGTVEFLKSIGSCAVKISSGEITHEPLLQAAARSGMAVLFDTGRASLAEVARAVQVLIEAGCEAPVVMHNPSGYPAHAAEVNLGLIPIYRSSFGLPVGFSCHSRGNHMVHGALAVGASVIEKPLSRDNSIEDDEHVFSVNLHDLSAFVREIREMEQALRTDAAKIYRGARDVAEKMKFRQSIVTARNLEKGRVLQESDLTFARPGHGLQPAQCRQVVGRTLRLALREGTVLLPQHLF